MSSSKHSDIKFHIRRTLSRLKRRVLNGGYFSLNALDRKLERFVNYDNGFYVELGANDGFTQSNSYYFELKRGWKGVLIEPSPHNYLHCLSLRGNNNKVHCNACVPFDYPHKFVEIEYANLMSLSTSLTLDVENRDAHLLDAVNHMQSIHERFTFGAAAKTLESILNESNAPKTIDFLSLDVEGAELDVLKGVNHDAHRFKFILVECRKISQLENYLNNHDYTLIDKFSEHDYLFQNKRT